MLDGLLKPLLENPLSSLFSFIITFIPIYIAYILFQHPLSHIPGPLIRRLTSIPLIYSTWVGSEASSIAKLHAKYGPIVLIAPKDIDIADGSAIPAIYVEKGGFKKAPFYRNFDVDEHQTIFSTLDPARRAVRAKSVVPMFAMGRIREAAMSGNIIDNCVSGYIAGLEKAKAARTEAVDLLDMSRRLAAEVVTGYLFGEPWGSFSDERKASINGQLSISPFVDSLVAVGSIFPLPNTLFTILAGILLFKPSKAAEDSSNRVEAYTRQAVDAASDSKTDTYQKRLLNAGISKEETKAQMKDLIFAGTDSTGTTMSKLLWNLVQQPDLQHALYEEVTTDPDGPTPLLHATVREGLRTAMANPTQLARMVPEQGWTYTAPLFPDEEDGSRSGKAYSLPGGTRVGCQMYSLHWKPETYPEPMSFDPYRWLPADVSDGKGNKGGGDAAKLALMNRDWFAFGAGTRQCIARNLATEELLVALRRVVESRVLQGAKAIHRDLPIREWFNSQLLGKDGILISFAAA